MEIQQGDHNRSALRQQFVEQLSDETKKRIDEDASLYLHQALSSPVMNIVSSVKGPYFYDLSGNQYLDCHGNGVHNVGFSHPSVLDAARSLLDASLTFSPRRLGNVPSIKLAKKLVQLAPDGFDRVLFCPGGSEANEMAVLLARLYTGNYKTLSFYDSFHGATALSACIGGNPHFTEGFGPMMSGCLHVEFPSYYRNPWKLPAYEREKIDDLYIHQVCRAFAQNPTIAAVIATPISSSPHVPSSYYWMKVREICNQYGALLIFDEIVCGLGRTGKLFATEHFVEPDIIVIGKSLGGGLMPSAAIITKSKFNIGGEKSVGHFTHEKNPVAGAVGLAVLETIGREGLVNNAQQQGSYLMDKLMELKEEHSIIGNIVGRGLLVGIDLVTDRARKKKALSAAERIMYFCQQAGLSFKIIDGNTISLRPALTISSDHVDFICETLNEAFKSVSND